MIYSLDKMKNSFNSLKHIFTRGQILAFGYCRCLRLSVRPCIRVCVRERVCVNPVLVGAISRRPFKLGLTNLT